MTATPDPAPAPAGPFAGGGAPEGFTLRSFPKGHLLSTPAGARDQVFVVASGRLRVFLAGESRELALAFLEPGDLYTTHTPAYVETVAPSALWLIETPRFAHRLAADPAMVPVLMRVLGRLLSGAIGLVEDLAFREVPERLARFLAGLAARRGVPLAGGGVAVPFELGMEDLASLLGSTRQTVSMLINQWEREGLLRREGRRRLVLPAPDAFVARAARGPHTGSTK